MIKKRGRKRENENDRETDGAYWVEPTQAIGLEGRALVRSGMGSKQGKTRQCCSWLMNMTPSVPLPLMMANVPIPHLNLLHQAVLSDLTFRLGRLGFAYRDLGASKDI